MQAKVAKKQLLQYFASLRDIRAGWEIVSDDSRQTATQMVNIILEMEHLSVEQGWRRILKNGAFPHLRERLEGCMWEEVSCLSTNLAEQVEDLEDLVDQMHEVCTSIDEMANTGLKSTSGGEGKEEPPPPLFLVSTLDNFAAMAREILGMYEKELELRKGIAKDLPRTKRRVQLMAYLSAWTVGVFIDAGRIDEVEDAIKTESVLEKAIPG